MEELGELCSTRAIDIRHGTLDKCDFLRQVALFIIHNKNSLPDDILLSLFDAFGKRNKSSATRPSRSRANNARERIEQAREIDIMPSPEILTSIARIKETPSDFWTAELSVELDWDANILRHIYHGNRQNDKLAVTYRAFYTTATYLFIRSICEAFNVRILTDRVLRHCTALVDPHHEEDTKLVKKNLRDDYKAGLIWNTYAERLGGYGAFFLIGVAPTWVFEISLNQSDDLRFAVSHFKLIKVPQTATQYSLHGVGSKIISEITRRVGSSLPQKRSMKKRVNKKSKAPKSGRSRTAKTGGSAEAVERTEDGPASLEIRALQDDHSSAPTEVNQPHTQCVYSAPGNEGLASSNLGSFTAPRNHVAPMHVSQMPLQYDSTVSSQQTMTVAPLGSPVHSSPNSSFSTSLAPSEPAEPANVAAPQPRNAGMQQNINIGAIKTTPGTSLNYQAAEPDQIPSVQRDFNEEQDIGPDLQYTPNTSFDAFHPNTVPDRPYIPGSWDFNDEELQAPTWYSYQPGLLDMNTENLYPSYEPGANPFDMNSWPQFTTTDCSSGIA